MTHRRLAVAAVLALAGCEEGASRCGDGCGEGEGEGEGATEGEGEGPGEGEGEGPAEGEGEGEGEGPAEGEGEGPAEGEGEGEGEGPAEGEGEGEGEGPAEGEGEGGPDHDCQALLAYDVCTADPKCLWAAPGCAEPGDFTPALPEAAAGCAPRAPCEAGACPQGQVCREFVHDPCHRQACDACGGYLALCVDEALLGGGECEDGKFGTSGMAQPMALGASCEMLVACFSGEVGAGLRASLDLFFPGISCKAGRDCLEHMGASICACPEGTVSNCGLWVNEVDRAEYDAACRLSRRDDVTAVTCAGDL